MKFFHDDYVVGAWCHAIPDAVGRPGDVLYLVRRDREKPLNWELEYRFRYYKDEKVHFDETEDEKYFYGATIENTDEAEVIAAIRAVVNDSAMGKEVLELLVQGSIDDLLAQMAKHPEWFSQRPERAQA